MTHSGNRRAGPEARPGQTTPPGSLGAKTAIADPAETP
jgi:hypothetical protein